MLGFSAVPQLIGYFMRIHESYAVEQDVAVLKEKISIVQQEVSQLDDKFFRNHLEKPLGTLDGAVDKVRRVLYSVKTALASDVSTHLDNSFLPPPKEEEIAVPA